MHIISYVTICLSGTNLHKAATTPKMNQSGGCVHPHEWKRMKKKEMFSFKP